MGIFTRRAKEKVHSREVEIIVHDGDLELGADAGRHQQMTFDDAARPLTRVLARATAEASCTSQGRVDENGRLRTDALGSVYVDYTLPTGSTMHVRIVNMQHFNGLSLCSAALQLTANVEETDAVALVDRVAYEAAADLRALNTLAKVNGPRT